MNSGTSGWVILTRNLVGGSHPQNDSAEAWGRHSHFQHDVTRDGERLLCTKAFLKRILKAENCDLLLLIFLERYAKGYSNERSKYWHTTAVVRVRQNLNFEYFSGALNKLHENTY
jgi:hypothetical protein